MYQNQGKSFDFPDLTSELCPQCKGDFLKKHGFYERYLITIGFEGEIIIRRYYCEACKKTVSLLPSFCHPKRTYSILVIIGLLTEFYIRMSAVCTAVLNFFKTTDVECTRQLLLQYRRRVEKNLNSLIMAVTEIHALRSPPVTEKRDIREKVRQFLSTILNPQDESLKIFERTGRTYLTPQTI
ncbi:MAG: DUF6431 domain-containing protein [Treponema sp.]|nr:DUF6431 domain-containing protein [Treponema sp.]